MDIVLKFLNCITTLKTGFMLEIILCEILFSIGAKTRRHKFKPLFWLMSAACLVAYFTIGRFVPLLKIPGVTALILFVMSFAWQIALFDVSINRILYNSVSAYIVQNIAINVREILLYYIKMTALNSNGWAIFFIRTGFTLLVYALMYFIFARRINNAELNIHYPRLYVGAFISLFVCDVMYAIAKRSGVDAEVSLYIKVGLAVCGIITLMYQYSVFTSSNLDKEKKILNSLLYKEQKQHELTQETIDVINIKCHDLKKQMRTLRQTLGEESGELIREAEKAVNIYESLVNTGNKSLDLILFENMLYCRNHEIPIQVVADGNAIGFMEPADIYSLFSNILSNAVEGSLKEESSLRDINFKLHQERGYVCIACSNYCSRNLHFVGGRPKTDKADVAYHGYGIRSMQFIVEKYGGNLVIDNSGNSFLVKILIPIPC